MTKHNFLPEALVELRPGAVLTVRDGEIFWEEDITEPTEEEIQAKIAELEAAEPLRLLRIERTKLLQQSDWMANSDVVMTDEWKAYRQALRDLPETQTPALDDNGNLINVEWPTPPGETSVS